MSMWYWLVFVRVAPGHRGEALVPVRHAVDDAVRLGGRGDVPPRPLLRQLEGVAHHPVAAAPGEHRLLHRQLVGGVAVEPAADLRVLAFVVLAHDQHVDVRRARGRRAASARPEQPHRPQVHVLVELAADRDQEPPERDVVGHAGESHRAQVDRVEAAELLEPVLRHHAPGPRVDLAAPVELLPRELYAEAAPGRLEHPDPLGQDFLADTIAGNDRDPMRHREPPQR